MSVIPTLNEIISEIRQVSQPQELWHLCVQAFHDRGIDKVSYHRYLAPQTPEDETSTLRITTDGFRDDWVCHYINAKLFRVDPIPGLARLAATPFFWSDVSKLIALNSEEEDYLTQMHEAGLGDGLAFQVYGPAMNNAYVGLGFRDKTDHPSPIQVAELQCLAQTAHLRACEFRLHDIEVRFELSRREREILEWIARGKSNSVIAGILDVSPHTVDTHVRRMFDKLGVTDRTSAAIRGVGSGLILPP